MEFIIDFLKGVIIGAGCILPGISSGVLCVIFGIYEKLLNSVLNFLKDIRKNFKFLLPIILGAIIGILLFSNMLNYLLYKYPLQTKSIFIGLIFGGIIILFKDINKKEKFKIKNSFYICISLIIGIILVFLENRAANNFIQNTNYIYLVFSGFLMSIGIVVPGVSSTIILMLLGIYPLYLNSISNLYLPVLIPIGIGVISGSIIFMKIIKYLLDNFYVQTMYVIMGFTLGSIAVLFPEIQTKMDIFLSFFCIILGYYIIKNLNL